jgi:hypothetical protein
MNGKARTPGPWTVSPDPADEWWLESVISGPDGDIVASTHMDCGHGDAELIAAAPDLLDVCMDIARIGHFEHLTIAIKDKAKAAIAKARGEK